MECPEVQATSVGDCRDCYFVWTRDFEPARYCSVYLLPGEQPAVVDTGTGANVSVILEALAELGIDRQELEAILLTHVHLDHAGGAARLAEKCPNAEVYVHEGGAPHLIDPGRLWTGTKAAVGDQIKYYADPQPIPPERIVELTDGDHIDLGDRRLAVHEAPGHAFHQVIFHDAQTGGVFTGDSAGVKTPGLDRVQESSPPPGFDLQGCLADVELIQELDPTALYLAHYGDHQPEPLLTTYATVLENWVESVTSKRTEMAADAVIEHFVAEADTVDTWGPVKARSEAGMNVRGVLAYLDE